MYIELKQVNKYFGSFQASKDVTFGVEKGKLIALLGPSGSGKTTILRILAGLEKQENGDVYIDGKLMNTEPVQKRGIGFVFQNYALFPYMTVYNNIAYGLKIQKKDKSQIDRRVKELLELVEIPGLENRYPSQLSGGQCQRVAFARALATEPQVLLLDEPFAAIDAKVRKELRRWLKDTIEKIGITCIFVTHDQDEAVEVADELIITNEGRIEQMGTPIEIYRNPKTPFVARFIGESVVLENYEYEKLNGFERLEGKPNAAIRPEFVRVAASEKNIDYPSAYMDGLITHVEFRGNYTELTVMIAGIELKAEYQMGERTVKKGDNVKAMVTRMFAFDDVQAYNLSNSIFSQKEEYYI